GLLAVGAPVPLIRARVGIEDDDAVIAVAVRDVDFIGGGIDLGVGRTAELRRVVAGGLRAGLADLQDDLSVRPEFQHLPVILAVAADPNESLRVDADAVLILKPVVALSRAAPGLEQIALL